MSIKTFRSWVQCHSLLLLLTAPALVAQDHNVSGNLEVSGKADILAGPLSLGTAHFFDESNVETQAEGFTIHYSETPQTWAESNVVKGRSSVVFRVGQELANFTWQASIPDGLGGFTGEELMQLSSERLNVYTSLTAHGATNILPNQTLSAGNASILTLALGDNRYLNKSGGTISGNLTITGSTLTVNGNNVLTAGGVGYIKVASSGEIISDGASATPWTSGISIGGGGAVTGLWAVAVGNLSRSTGETSIALGREANAGAGHSIAIGRGPFVSGEHAIGIGTYSAAYTNGSIVIGQRLKAQQLGQIVIGNFNEESAYAPNYANSTDWLFVIGNGTADDARSNALIVKRNGDMEVKGTSLKVNGSEVLHRSGDGYIKVREDGAIIGGFQSVTADWTDGIVIGKYAQAGFRAVSIGGHAGYIGALASGDESVSLGYSARAPSSRAIGVGYATWAAGDDVVAIGHGATTRSLYATAIGRTTEANQVGQVVLGAFNELTVQSASPHSSDTIFILGNGISDTARSNALIIKRNGNMEVKGTSLTVNGAEVLTQSSADALYVTQTTAASTYLSTAEAQSLYQPKLPTNINYLTSSDLTTIHASIASMIDPDELDTALEGYLTTNDKTELLSLIDDAIDEDELTAALAGFQVDGDYLSKDPQVGLAYGVGSAATSSSSVAIGESVSANQSGQVVVGRHNEAHSAIVGPDTPVFVVGAGSGQSGAPDEKKNALVVRRDGNVHVKGVIRVMPAGNLSMTGYEQGPKPVEEQP